MSGKAGRPGGYRPPCSSRINALGELGDRLEQVPEKRPGLRAHVLPVDRRAGVAETNAFATCAGALGQREPAGVEKVTDSISSATRSAACGALGRLSGKITRGEDKRSGRVERTGRQASFKLAKLALSFPDFPSVIPKASSMMPTGPDNRPTLRIVTQAEFSPTRAHPAGVPHCRAAGVAGDR